MELKPLKIRFCPKLKANERNQAVLYMRMTIDGKRAEISLNYEFPREAWDDKAQSLKQKHPEVSFVLNQMNQYRHRALEIQQQLVQHGIQPDVFAIKQRITGDPQTGKTMYPTLLELIDKAITRKIALTGKDNSKATVQKYRRCQSHLLVFLKLNYQKEDIACNKIDLQFIEDFELYLKTTGNCANNTSMKHIQTFKTIYRTATAHGWTDKDPFQKFKIKMQEVVRDYLSEKEIQCLLDADLPPNKCSKARDMFLFSCFTGLAYIDLRNLYARNIQKEKGKYWIRTRRQKTDVKSNIPLLDIPLDILKKYCPDFEEMDPMERLFKVISNQKMNAYLKELGTLLRIKKKLTFHIARHTFATTVTLNNGVPIESVSSMLGHKKITTTQHYAKLLDKKLEEDMAALGGKLRFNTTG